MEAQSPKGGLGSEAEESGILYHKRREKLYIEEITKLLNSMEKGKDSKTIEAEIRAYLKKQTKSKKLAFMKVSSTERFEIFQRMLDRIDLTPVIEEQKHLDKKGIASKVKNKKVGQVVTDFIKNFKEEMQDYEHYQSLLRSSTVTFDKSLYDNKKKGALTNKTQP